MHAINGGGLFLLKEAVTFARLRKYIYGGGRLNVTASENSIFTEAGVLTRPPRLILC